MCQVLAATFSTNYSHSSTSNQTFTAGTVNICDALHVLIDEVILFKALSKVKSCSAGPDNIPGILINKLAGPLTRPLAVLVQQSLFQRHIPLDWNVAKVIRARVIDVSLILTAL